MGLTGSNFGIFRAPGFIVSPVGKGETREKKREKKEKGRREKGNRKRKKYRKKERI